jgi:tetratricopeptide (TPR) repeat protein
VEDELKQKGARYLERAVTLGTNVGEAHVSKGVSLDNAGKPEAAIAEYRRGLALSPGYASGWQWLGEVTAYTYGDYTQALPLLAKARELDPLSPVINGTYLFHLAQSGRVDEALTGMDASIAENPRVARSYDDRAFVHQMRGDLVASLRDSKREAELDPKAYGMRSNRCMTMMDFGALDEAEACLRPLVAQAPNAPFAGFTQSRLAYLRGDLGSAERFVQATDDWPGNPYYAAVLRVRRNDPQGALAIYRTLIPDVIDESRAPRPGEAYDALQAGIALMRTGEDARGRRLIRVALAKLQDRPYMAAVAPRGWAEVIGNEALGDRSAALAALQRGVDAGFAQYLAGMDADPTLADLRKDPQYERILAPSRAMARAQVAAAREAGLLGATTTQ